MKKSIVCGGEIIELSTPRVMGILNITPDSFYDGGKLSDDKALLSLAEKHLINGATFLDIGAVSTRPNATFISEEEELKRILPALNSLVKEFPEAHISIDTFRANVANASLEHGAQIINDISGGTLDTEMFSTIAKWNVPYVLMHTKGTPQNMKSLAHYDDLVTEVFNHLLNRTHQLMSMGVKDIILDLGFGFAKTIDHNFQLLNNLERFKHIGHPLLVGISRKSMIYKTLDTVAEQALNGTTFLNALSLSKGASILRVHDAREAQECIALWQRMANN